MRSPRPELEHPRQYSEHAIVMSGNQKRAARLAAFAEFTNNGLTGEPNGLSNGANGIPDPILWADMATCWPDAAATIPTSNRLQLNIPLRNRAARPITSPINWRCAERAVTSQAASARFGRRQERAVLIGGGRLARVGNAVSGTYPAQHPRAEQRRFHLANRQSPWSCWAQWDLNLTERRSAGHGQLHFHAKCL
jgi:hypothetical protein